MNRLTWSQFFNQGGLVKAVEEGPNYVLIRFASGLKILSQTASWTSFLFGFSPGYTGWIVGGWTIWLPTSFSQTLFTDASILSSSRNDFVINVTGGCVHGNCISIDIYAVTPVKFYTKSVQIAFTIAGY